MRQSPIVPRRRVSLCRYARRYRLAYYDASKGGGADDSVLPPLAAGDALRVVGGGGEDERGAASGDNDETDDGVAEADRGAGGGGGGDGGLTLHASETKPPARFTEARRTRRVREREGSYIESRASCEEHSSYRALHATSLRIETLTRGELCRALHATSLRVQTQLRGASFRGGRRSSALLGVSALLSNRGSSLRRALLAAGGVGACVSPPSSAVVRRRDRSRLVGCRFYLRVSFRRASSRRWRSSGSASDACCFYMPAQWVMPRLHWAAGEKMCHLLPRRPPLDVRQHARDAAHARLRAERRGREERRPQDGRRRRARADARRVRGAW